MTRPVLGRFVPEKNILSGAKVSVANPRRESVRRQNGVAKTAAAKRTDPKIFIWILTPAFQQHIKSINQTWTTIITPKYFWFKHKTEGRMLLVSELKSIFAMCIQI